MPSRSDDISDNRHQENLDLARWRREWESNGRPVHSCIQESVFLLDTLRSACGVCGVVIEV